MSDIVENLRIDLAAKETEALGYLRAVGQLQKRCEELEAAASAYVASVNGEPEKDCWDTEDGKEAPGAERFASDWSWQEYDAKKQKAFDELRAVLSNNGGE